MFPGCYEARGVMRTALEYLQSLKVVTRKEMLEILNRCSKRHNNCFRCPDKIECKRLYDKRFCETEDVVVEKHSAKAQ